MSGKLFGKFKANWAVNRIESVVADMREALDRVDVEIEITKRAFHIYYAEGLSLERVARKLKLEFPAEKAWINRKWVFRLLSSAKVSKKRVVGAGGA